MRAINYLKIIILILSIDLNAQSFEKSLIENRNIIPYPFNEYNAYFNSTLDIIYFNSSKNLNNVGGLSDLNDIWLRANSNAKSPYFLLFCILCKRVGNQPPCI